MHPSFRVHDYFVGVYDGVFTIAQALELTRAELAAPVSERRAPSRQTFENVARALIGDDADLSRFVMHLFEYESFWTGSAGTTSPTFDRCHLGPAAVGLRDTDREDANAFRVFEALCKADAEGRSLNQAGKVAALSRHLYASTGFQAVTDAVPDLLGDPNAWAFGTTDRLVRRAIDIERATYLRQIEPEIDAGQQHPHARSVEYLLLTSRLLSASTIDRSREIVDLDPSTVERLSGGSWTAGRVLAHLLPHYVTWDSVHSRVSIGWEPKLRFPYRLYVPVGADLGYYPHETARPVDDGTPRSWELRTTVAGVGLDPPVWWMKDVQLGMTVSSSLARPFDARSWGLELAAHPLAGKLRVSIGFPQAIDSQGGPNSLAGRFSVVFATIGISDLNGLLYWFGRSAAGVLWPTFCEDGCDRATN
jgi:hypothetical protein